MTDLPRRLADAAATAALVPVPGGRARGVRAALVGLTGVVVLATAVELAVEGLGTDPVALVPWAALGVLVLGVAAVLVPTRGGLAVSRVLAALVLAASVYGVLDHVVTRHESGDHGPASVSRWVDLPPSEEWWTTVTRTVGPSPTLAPGVVALAAALLLLAGVGRPVRTRGR